MNRTRTSRPRILVAVALGAIAVGIVAVVALGPPAGRDPDRAVLFVPLRPQDAGPADDVTWWSAVNGEPLGVAVDGTDVAVAALDEVRLVDGRDGRTRWTASFPGVRRYRPALGTDRVAATSETELAVLDRADGSLVATVPFAGPGPAAVLALPAGPVVAAGSETGALTVVDARTGAPRWSVTYPGEMRAAPRGADGVVVAAWRDTAGTTLRAFDADTGALRWDADLGAVAGPPLLAGDALVVAGGADVHTGEVRALDLRTGALRWHVPLAGWWDDELEPAVDGPEAYLLDGMGTVVALDLASGTVRWRRETGRPLVDGRLALTPEAVVLASSDDELVALDRRSGSIRAVEPQRGVPIDVAGLDDGLVVALRLGAPSRVEARPGP